jgi:hypothetical protein
VSPCQDSPPLLLTSSPPQPDLPDLSPRDAALFEAYIEDKPLTETARSHAIRPDQLNTLLNSSPLAAHIAAWRRLEHDRSTARSIARLERVQEESKDLVEVRRAACAVLRAINSARMAARPQRQPAARIRIHAGRAPSSTQDTELRTQDSQHSAPSTQHSSPPSTQHSPYPDQPWRRYTPRPTPAQLPQPDPRSKSKKPAPRWKPPAPSCGPSPDLAPETALNDLLICLQNNDEPERDAAIAGLHCFCAPGAVIDGREVPLDPFVFVGTRAIELRRKLAGSHDYVYEEPVRPDPDTFVRRVRFFHRTVNGPDWIIWATFTFRRLALEDCEPTWLITGVRTEPKVAQPRPPSELDAWIAARAWRARAAVEHREAG